jgi:Fur family ferric uptake transcriptional regulator
MGSRSGKRQTHQRHAVRHALENADRPLSPREILDAARAEVPGLGIATVYRHIRSLVEEGWLHTVELPGAPDRYERAGKDHHHHFHCRECDRVYDIEAGPGGIRALAPRGYRVETHEITLYGLCRECR